MTGDQRLLMEGVVNLAAISIERASFAQQASQAEMMRNTEKLQTALLNSISHELRTPLATITGVLSSLEDSESAPPANQLDSATRLDLIHSATRQAGRLNHLVENLLDMTRLESGGLRLNLEPTDIQDLINTVTRRLEVEYSPRVLRVEMTPELPLVSMDAVLIAQVLNNLIDNAVKYSPAQTPITISVKLSGKPGRNGGD